MSEKRLIKTSRIVINSNDIQILTEYSARHSRRKLEEIRNVLGKRSNAHITFKEYARYHNIKLEEIEQALGLRLPYER